MSSSFLVQSPIQFKGIRSLSEIKYTAIQLPPES